MSLVVSPSPRQLTAFFRAAFLSLLSLFFCASAAQAQLEVRLVRPDASYMLYAPILVKVQVINLSGNPITLNDVNGQPWLRFTVRRSSGLLAPIAQKFRQKEVTIPSGNSLEFDFDLTPYYAIREIASYRIRALVQVDGQDGDYMSDEVELSVVNGDKLWSKSLGTSAGDTRNFSLLTHLAGNDILVYAQIDGNESGLVYACRPLGKIMNGFKPECILDGGKFWHILYRLDPKVYRYCRFTFDGGLEEIKDYAITSTRPQLYTGHGIVEVIGGLDAVAERGDTLGGTQPPDVLRAGSKPSLPTQPVDPKNAGKTPAPAPAEPAMPSEPSAPVVTPQPIPGQAAPRPVGSLKPAAK